MRLAGDADACRAVAKSDYGPYPSQLETDPPSHGTWPDLPGFSRQEDG